MALAQLLSLPEIEKKQLQSLGRAFLLISMNCQENWDLVHGEFQRIGAASLDTINDKLLQVTVRFQAVGSLHKTASMDVDYSPSKDEEEKKERT